MRKKYTEIYKNIRNYIPLELGEGSFKATKINENMYSVKEIILCGAMPLEITFVVMNNGTITSPVSNNYFGSLDVVPNMLAYPEYKKDLMLRIKLDMEEKRINNMSTGVAANR